jgi:hypothetical protein
MTIERAYTDLVRILNRSIRRFNTYLSANYQLDPLGLDFSDAESYTNLKTAAWNEQHWPNSGDAGVYFLLGRDDSSHAGLYVGKASLTRAIGHRLWVWLQANREGKDYFKDDSQGTRFYLEYVTSISTTKREMVFMAPSIEEFLITDLRTKLHLLNDRGNMK